MNEKWKARCAAALVSVLGLGAIAGTVSGSTAFATSATNAAATCTQYVINTPLAVEVWIDPDSTVYNHIWNKLPRGHVFCAYEKNVANTRFRVRYNCHPAQNCNPVGPYTAWITTDPHVAVPVNCAVHTLAQQVTVFTNGSTDEAWTTWPAGTAFCDYGRNYDGSRYQVYVFCGLPACHRPEGVWAGYVTSNPAYYV